MEENDNIINDIDELEQINEDIDDDLNVNAYLAKFNNIANELGVSTKQMEENVKNKVSTLKKSNSLNVQNAVVTLETLQSDFQILRQNLMENIKSSQLVLTQFSTEIVAEGADVKPTLLSAYSELVESCNSSIKLMSMLYKDIADTYLKIKKLEETNEERDNPEKSKTINNLIITNTEELLNKIRGD